MIPTLMLFGLVFGRWPVLALIAGTLGWPVLLYLGNIAGWSPVLALPLALLNTAIGVGAHQGIMRLVAAARRR